MSKPAPAVHLSAAFSALRHSLLSYLRKRVGDAAVAEDLLQEVFVKALTAAKNNRTPSNLTAWLYTVAKTTVMDFYRSRRPSEPLDDDFPDRRDDDERLQQELSECLKPLTRQLAPIYRDTLIAADFEGRTLQSLASEWGLSLSAVKSRASRARGMLKDKLVECCHIEVSAGVATDYYPKATAATCGCRGGCS
jgi:RNA polymerase sigma-70 factor (ECF subfamily)